MKTRALTVGLVASLLLNIYLLNSRKNPSKELGSTSSKNQNVRDVIATSKSAIKSQQKEKSANELAKTFDAANEKTEAFENSAIYTGLPTEEELIESQERWRENITDFFLTGLDLRESDVDKYYEIKRSRERELSQFLTERIRSQGSFIYTLEDMVDENKINEKYLNRLKDLMGEQGYNSYRAFRDGHNQQMIESQQMHSLIEL